MRFPAISVREPWASLMFLPCVGRKNVENRAWTTLQRGRLYVHVSGTLIQRDYRATMEELRELIADGFFPGLTWDDVAHLEEPPVKAERLGCFIGAVELHDVSTTSTSPWAVPGSVHLGIRRPYRVDKPVPFRGRPDLFFVNRSVFRGRRFMEVKP